MGKRAEKPLEELFWAKVEKTETCWNWKGAFWKTVPISSTRHPDWGRSARRISYGLTFHSKPDRKLTHICGNSQCVNPHHTTHHIPIGKLRGKLNALQVAEIRDIWAKHLESSTRITTMKELGSKFGVTKQAIESIVNNKVYKEST